MNNWARTEGYSGLGYINIKDRIPIYISASGPKVAQLAAYDPGGSLGGRGVDVAYDAVGKDTFDGTLNSLRPRGMFVSFGNASGPVPPFIDEPSDFSKMLARPPCWLPGLTTPLIWVSRPTV